MEYLNSYNYPTHSGYSLVSLHHLGLAIAQGISYSDYSLIAGLVNTRATSANINTLLNNKSPLANEYLILLIVEDI
jgi:hypothetical protein